MEYVVVLVFYLVILVFDFLPERESRGKTNDILYLTVAFCSLLLIMLFLILPQNFRLSTALRMFLPYIQG